MPSPPHVFFSLCLPSLPSHPLEQRNPHYRESRRPSFRRRTTKPIQRSLSVNVQQTASEWSRTTSRLFETALFRPPPVSTGLAPLPPDKDTSVSAVRKPKTRAMAHPRAPRRSGLHDERFLSPAAIAEVMKCIESVFGDMWHAVSGLAAMVHYGFNTRYPSQVTVECPLDMRDNIRGWARARGLRHLANARSVNETVDHCLNQRHFDVFLLTTPSGFDRQIEIDFVQNLCEADRIWDPFAQAWVLSLPSLADRVAQDYVQSLILHDGEGQWSTRQQAACAEDMGWLLYRIINEPESSQHRLSADRVPHIVDRNFWLPFTLSYWESVQCFKKAGLALDDEMQGSYMLSSDPSESDNDAQQEGQHRHEPNGSSITSYRLSLRSWLNRLRRKLFCRINV